MRVTVGSATSAPGGDWRPEDRIAVGPRAWIVLGGTQNEHAGVNEADVAAPIAEALVAAEEPPSVDAVLAALAEMDRAVHAWELAGRGELFSTFLGAEILIARPSDVVVVHVGIGRTFRMQPDFGFDGDGFHPEKLTSDDEVGTGDKSMVTASIGQLPIWRISSVVVPVTRPNRFVLTSRGAREAMETPVAYLREVATPKECAERICAEARVRGNRHHASAIVVDVHPEPVAPYR